VQTTGTWQSGDPHHGQGHLSVVRGPGAASDATAWQAECACGWQGSVRDDPGQGHDGDRRSVPRVLRLAPRREWAAHVGSTVTMPVRRAAGEVARAQERLDAEVHRARLVGASWAQIGDAVGVTRQSAHERWSGVGRGANRVRTRIGRCAVSVTGARCRRGPSVVGRSPATPPPWAQSSAEVSGTAGASSSRASRASQA